MPNTNGIHFEGGTNFESETLSSGEFDVDILRREVTDIEKSLGSITATLQRLDKAFDKLTEVSESLSKLLAITTTRLENQETRMNNFQEAFNKHADSDLVAFRRQEEKLDAMREKVTETVSKTISEEAGKIGSRITVMEHSLGNLTANRNKWQGGLLVAVTIMGWIVAVWDKIAHTILH